MSYRVNAASSAGAKSVLAASLEKARDIAEELKCTGYVNIVVMDAGTGQPVEKGEFDPGSPFEPRPGGGKSRADYEWERLPKPRGLIRATVERSRQIIEDSRGLIRRSPLLGKVRINR